MRPLRVGVQLPEVERFVPWPEYRDMAMAAEAVGFDSIWVGDHLLYRQPEGPSGPWEAWSMLAALATVTDVVRLGPLVAATSFHNPAMLAKKATTVDEISNGRLILGLGAGWNRTEYDAYGFPYDRRASRFEEAFTIIRTLLTAGEIDFDGEFYQLSDCVLVPPARPGGIPLMIGSEGPRMLAAALSHVQIWNGWHAWYGNTPQGAAELNAKVDAACDSSGVDRGAIERTVTILVGGPGGSNRPQGSPNRASSHPLVGSPEKIAIELTKFHDVGIHEVQLVVDPITVESIKWLGSVLTKLDQ
ncbi:MAG: LLM class flavin-dependent oxidoreductase [Acidimicrobiia bacterium]|nr:LLM class flavin-dependent oxidoreductase [Acidimicrobiia bacterium]